MDFKTLFCKLLGIILCVLGLVGCEPPCQKIYYPILPFTVYPAKDTIRIGDTLWLRSDITTNIKDWKNENIYQYKNFDFQLVMALFQYIDTSKNVSQPTVPNKFIVGAKVGEIRKLKTTFAVRTVYKDDKYQLLGYIIPKDTGTYSMGMFSSRMGIDRYNTKIEVTDTKCDEYFGYINIQINEGKTNKYLTDRFWFFHAPTPNVYQEWSYVNSIYYFYVKR